MPENQPVVGVGVMVFKDGKILLGKRLGEYAAGKYQFPGGHMEYMETFAECAQRETKEECGLEIDNLRFMYLFNLRAYAPKHAVMAIFRADWKSGEPQVLEPDVCASWGWYDVDGLPEPCLETTLMAVESFRTGKDYFVS